MKKFIKKICLFLLPVVIFFAFPLFVIVSGKEYYSGGDAAAAQEKNNSTIFLYAYNNDLHYVYKKALIESRSPKIIVFGTSRAMQIRKEFFTNPDGFINAGASGTSLGDIEAHIRALPTRSTPSLILIGLDREMFLLPPPLQTYGENNPAWERILSLTVENARKIYMDFYQKKFSIHDLIASSQKQDAVGLYAITKQSGFRFDGSLKPGPQLETKARSQWLQADVLFNLANTDFLLSPMTDQQKTIVSLNINTLENILQLSKQKGIKVVAYLSPYPTAFYKTMDSGGANTPPDKVSFEKYYVDDNYLSADLRKIFSQYGASFFNLTDIKQVNSNDNEFLDSGHGTDKFFLKAIIYMANNSNIFKQFVDLQKLNDMLAHQPGDYLNF